MNSYGKIFRISLFGESHGKSVGVVVDNVPPGMPLKEEDFMEDIIRRKSGAKGTTDRHERDEPTIISGVCDGITTGAPIAITFENKDTRSKDYGQFRDMPRPGHSDFTANEKYNGYNDIRGGGMFSARLTLALVSAGVIAKKIIAPITFTAKIEHIGGNTNFDQELDKVIAANDSVGGYVSCVGKNVPVGLGDPYFGKFDAELAKMIFSLPAVKAFEVGSGIEAGLMNGSVHNDRLIDKNGKSNTNYSGGITGGISNGNDVEFRVTFKPTSSIAQPQKTFNFKSGKIEEYIVEGRHDACVTLRTPAIIEACAAIVTADLMLYNTQYSYKDIYKKTFEDLS